jgi:hypothetical protein
MVLDIIETYRILRIMPIYVWTWDAKPTTKLVNSTIAIGKQSGT